jgi:aminoglycoside phosphotransferase family enzyme/predicted kinase
MSAEPEISQERIIAFLSRADAYPDRVEVRRIDTHGAVVFLAGADVFKMKRAVRFPFMDYSTLEKRKAACEAEIRINAAFTPELYLGTVPVTAEGGSLRIGGTGEPVEWLVHLRRFDETQTLDHVTERGGLTPALVADVARLILGSHEKAALGEAEAAFRQQEKYLDQNDAAFRDFPDLFPPERADALTAASRSVLAELRPLLIERGRRGRVRRCHGDLHLRNIVLIEGKPRLFDALEFDESVATGDVLYDLAFLLMDLCCRGRLREANLLMNRYLWEAPDQDLAGIAALPLFTATRGGIRAKVTAAEVAHLAGERRQQAEEEAKAYFALAEQALAPSPTRLLVIGGLSGTGKSTLASALAPAIGRLPGAVQLRSDIERKKALGIGELERLPASAYGLQASGAVYARLRERAAMALRTGQSVVLDAVHARQHEREAAEQVARDVGCELRCLWLDAPRPVMADRVERRTGDASDADRTVVEFQAGLDLGDITWPRLETEGDPDEVREKAERLVA